MPLLTYPFCLTINDSPREMNTQKKITISQSLLVIIRFTAEKNGMSPEELIAEILNRMISEQAATRGCEVPVDISPSRIMIMPDTDNTAPIPPAPSMGLFGNTADDAALDLPALPRPE